MTRIGKDADIVLLDKNLDVDTTIVGGTIIYRKQTLFNTQL